MQDSGLRSSRWARTSLNFQAGKFQVFFGDASAWKMRHFFHANTSQALPTANVFMLQNKVIRPNRSSLKTLNANGRYEISKRDCEDKFQLSKRVGALNR